jgi:hypothetical protein
LLYAAFTCPASSEVGVRVIVGHVGGGGGGVVLTVTVMGFPLAELTGVHPFTLQACSLMECVPSVRMNVATFVAGIPIEIHG